MDGVHCVTRQIFQLNRRFLAGPGRRLRPRSSLNRYPRIIVITPTEESSAPAAWSCRRDEWTERLKFAHPPQKSRRLVSV